MPAVIKIEIISSSADKGLKDTERGLRDIDKAAKNTKGGFDTLKGVGMAALGAVALAAGAAAVAIGGFVKDSISAAGAFEGAVNGLAAVTGDSLSKAGFSLEDVSAKALQLGQDTQYSAQEAILAMTELAKGGVPIASVMTDATDATLALAAAAGTDLAVAAEIVAKQLGVWAETGVSAAEVTDLIAGAANASTVGVEDLALGLAQAGGTAKTSGVEFAELVQTMALIAPNFSSASDAGTSLKTMISRLIPTTKPATAAMRDLGLYTDEAGSAFFNAQGEFVGMEEAARLLHAATSGLSEEQKLLAFNTIFGSDAIRAAAALANAGAEGYNAMGQAIADSGGATEAAAVKQQGFNFAMEQLSGSIETFQIIVGTKLLPILTPLIGQFTELVNATMGVASAIFDAGIGSGEFLESLGLLDAALRLAPGSAEAAYTSFMQIATTIQSYIPPALALAQAAFTNLSAFIATIMPTIQAIVSSSLTFIAAFWQAHGATILQVASSVWVAIQGVIQVVLGVIQGIIAIATATINGDWQTAFQSLASANEAIWNGIQTLLFGVLNTIAAFFGTTVDGLITLWSSNLSKLATIALTSINEALAAFRTAIAPAMEIGGAIISGIISGISSGAGKLAKAASDAANSALKAAKAALGIQSPSLVFKQQVGYQISAGMAEGILSGASLVTSASAGVAGASVGAAQGVTNTTNNHFNYSPTYSATPASPSADFGMMKSLATAGT